MSREGELLRRAFKRHLVPRLTSLGFAGKSSNFQRLTATAQDLLSIQYWKYGGSFILEFGRRERGPLLTAWGEIVPEEALDVAYLPISDRARLQERTEVSPEIFGGFRFDGFGEDVEKYDALALRVAAMLPQVDAWLSRREVGPDVRPFGEA